jgi:predicted dehydrogenase
MKTRGNLNKERDKMKHSEKIRIGVIGAGNIGSVHIKEFQKLASECEVIGISDVNQTLARAQADQYGIPNVFETMDQLIESELVDAVIIGVPNKFHAQLAVKALEAGKHVLLEKPMAIDLNAARQIVKAKQESKATLMVAHQMRWESVPLQIKEQMERNELGDIYTAKAGWYRRKGIPGWGTWFTQKELSGGGPLIDIGVHLLDLALHLMGNPKPVAVSGAAYAKFGPERKGIGTWGTPDWKGTFDVEDLATALIRMEDGSTLTLEVSWAVHMDTDNSPFIHLMGTEGGASYRGKQGKLLTEKFNRPIEVELNTPDSDEGERLRLSRHFLDCIREGKEPLTSVMTGFTSNLVLDAIYESSRTGKEVELNWEL